MYCLGLLLNMIVYLVMVFLQMSNKHYDDLKAIDDDDQVSSK